ncbi:nitrous oxide reductase accessory protein NosL [Bacillus mycoides]|uniref:nitrous oxide reductase accessory protein NosL n=1 Tax=Bacillus mycoides TaxID=1405 RepID=UPI00257122F7|nr:nitrous oxide reductase accessory protein NosL [Bacillus mycoides]WJE77327.1 nitrous oxide reductase accessory protein NosL [Bacillus mycoides]
MRVKYVVLVICVCFIFMAVGCGKQKIKAVAINEKHDKCDICQIGVMDNQFATEIILESGKALKFDDIGCMYKWMEINSGEKTKEKFVRDYDSKDWVSLEDATYVYDKTITTPMAYNVISFKNKKDAESFVSNYKGKVLSYKELSEHKWEMNKEMMGKPKTGNHGGHH